MLTGFGSYCDEFGHPKDPKKKVMGIAGLLGWSDDWITLSEKWREIQKTECIPTFHMTDFVHHTEAFSDKRWESAHERARILALLLDIIESAKVIPVSASVALKDFNELNEDQRKRLVSPYHIAFQEVTFNIAFATANKALESAKSTQDFFGNRAAMMYAKLKKFTGPAEQLWNAIKKFNPAAGNWMSSYTPGEPSAYPPLQAADMWAYSLGHMIEHKPPKKKEAETAFRFFVHAATSPDQALGHRFYTHFDRNEMLIRLGESPELVGDN